MLQEPGFVAEAGPPLCLQVLPPCSHFRASQLCDSCLLSSILTLYLPFSWAAGTTLESSQGPSISEAFMMLYRAGT